MNNAGITDWAEIGWSSIGDFQNMADVNLFGPIRTSFAFLPLIRASKGELKDGAASATLAARLRLVFQIDVFAVSGRMVYTSSIFAFFNCLNMGAYSVSKRGLEAFADCLRVEMASFGVKVQAEKHTCVLAV